MQKLCKVPPEHEIFNLFVWPKSEEHILCAIAKDADEKHIYIYDVMKGILLDEFRNNWGQNTHSNIISVFSFACSQSMFALGMTDGAIQLFDKRGQFNKYKLLQYHNDFVESMKFSPNEKLLASLAFSRHLTLYNTQDHTTRTITTTESGHTDHDICHVAWSVDSTLIASWSLDGIIQIHDVVRDTPPIKIEHPCRVMAACFTQKAGENILAFGDTNGQITVWDQHTNGSSPRTMHDGFDGHFLYSLTFIDEGKKLLSITKGGKMRVWDMIAEKVILNTRVVPKSSLIKPFDYILHPNQQQIVFRHTTSDLFSETEICITPIHPWSDRINHLFCDELRRIIFQLMCIKTHQEKHQKQHICLSMQLWLCIFQQLSYTFGY